MGANEGIYHIRLTDRQKQQLRAAADHLHFTDLAAGIKFLLGMALKDLDLPWEPSLGRGRAEYWKDPDRPPKTLTVREVGEWTVVSDGKDEFPFRRETLQDLDDAPLNVLLALVKHVVSAKDGEPPTK